MITHNHIPSKELIELAILQNQTYFNSNSIIKATLLFIYFEGKVSLFLYICFICANMKRKALCLGRHIKQSI